MWTTEINSNNLLEAFPTLIEKDIPSKGSFQEDYNFVCESNGIVKCPFITSFTIGEDGKQEGIRIANGKIDLSNWRAMLLAINTVGSKAGQLIIHFCTLSVEHLQALNKALIKSGMIKSLKIQYSELFQNEDEESQVIAALKGILAEANNLEIITIKNCNLTDSIVSGFAPALAENYRIAALNLSENGLSNSSCLAVLQAVKFNPNYRAISLSDNAITGEEIATTIINQYIGILSTVNEDNAIKAVTKGLADRNKAVKDLNKKRKKANLPEFNEFASTAELTKAYDGKQQYFANRYMEFLDLRGNPLNSNFFSTLAQSLSNLPTSLPNDVIVKILASNMDSSLADNPSFVEFSS